MQKNRSDEVMGTDQPNNPDDAEQIEGLDSEGRPWGDYPLDEMLIRCWAPAGRCRGSPSESG